MPDAKETTREAWMHANSMLSWLSLIMRAHLIPRSLPINASTINELKSENGSNKGSVMNFEL